MKRTKAEAEQTKNSLIDSALAVFLAKGYSSTSIEDITDHAGLSRGAFYWHFKSKVELHSAVCEQENRVVNEMLNRLLQENVPAFKKLQNYLEAVVDNFYNNKRFNQYVELTRLKSESGLLNEFSSEKLNTLDRSFKDLEKLIRHCKKEGSINTLHRPRDVARHINALITGIYRLYFTSAQHFGDRKTALKVVRDYLKLLQM